MRWTAGANESMFGVPAVIAGTISGMRGQDMAKTLDMGRSVHELCSEYPELLSILRDLGLKELTKKAALATLGRIMTIPMGASFEHLDLAVILPPLMERGFEITGISLPQDLSGPGKDPFAIRPFSEVRPAAESAAVREAPHLKEDVREV